MGGEFDVKNNRLVNLVGSPIKVGGDFYCDENLRLKSLKGVTLDIEGEFDCPQFVTDKGDWNPEFFIGSN